MGTAQRRIGARRRVHRQDARVCGRVNNVGSGGEAVRYINACTVTGGRHGEGMQS